MEIMLIDADSKIPNLPLMKLSTYYKNKGDNVELVRLNLSYYPQRKKKKFIVPIAKDKVFCSVIFKGNKDFILGKNVIFGGTLKEIIFYDSYIGEVKKSSSFTKIIEIIFY